MTKESDSASTETDPSDTTKRKLANKTLCRGWFATNQSLCESSCGSKPRYTAIWITNHLITPTNTNLQMKDQIDTWRSAVVHLECAADSVSAEARFERHRSATSLFEEGSISFEEWAKEVGTGVRDKRDHGTAIFVQSENRRYLITTRHLVHDKLNAERELVEAKKRYQSRPAGQQNDEEVRAQESASNRAFNIIFRVPSLIEDKRNNAAIHSMYLTNLSSGFRAFTFTDEVLDLAVISLDQLQGSRLASTGTDDTRFADDLESNGYVAIDIDNLIDEAPDVGTDVFTVGFPSAMSIVGRSDITLTEHNWRSARISEPAFAFGKVSMLNEHLDYFWCDMTIYPGNSGGPVVANGKLVGIVIGQPKLQSEIWESDGIRESDAKLLKGVFAETKTPFAQVVRSTFLKELLEKQKKKDAELRAFLDESDQSSSGNTKQGNTDS